MLLPELRATARPAQPTLVTEHAARGGARRFTLNVTGSRERGSVLVSSGAVPTQVDDTLLHDGGGVMNQQKLLGMKTQAAAAATATNPVTPSTVVAVDPFAVEASIAAIEAMENNINDPDALYYPMSFSLLGHGNFEIIHTNEISLIRMMTQGAFLIPKKVLTKQRNRGSKVQGVAETVVVGKRRQNSGVDVGWLAARSVAPTTCSTDCS
uniref:Uncharacterized protein n=1 Tax=Oryza punctata TaxID=4537 RepID=A0A0E0LIS2_ORYPU